MIEVLGAPDDFGIDVEIMIRKHHLPHRFPPEVMDQAQSIPAVITGAEMRGRRDFRDLPIVTIDGETARDFDDAVLVDKLPNGHYALQVHIADVSHYVTPGSAIDTEARLRGTSVYFPDRAVPDAAVRAFDQHLFADSACGPAGGFGAASNSIARASRCRSNSAAA